MLFVDNAGADVVLGQLPVARELLKCGCEVVMVANQQPAINDITAPELSEVMRAAAQLCPLIQAARQEGIRAQRAAGGRIPPLPPGAAQPPGARMFVVDNGQGSPCLNLRRVPGVLAEAALSTDLIIIEGMGR
jgi:type II pantothenate kinase